MSVDAHLQQIRAATLQYRALVEKLLAMRPAARPRAVAAREEREALKGAFIAAKRAARAGIAVLESDLNIKMAGELDKLLKEYREVESAFRAMGLLPWPSPAAAPPAGPRRVQLLLLGAAGAGKTGLRLRIATGAFSPVAPAEQKAGGFTCSVAELEVDGVGVTAQVRRPRPPPPLCAHAHHFLPPILRASPLSTSLHLSPFLHPPTHFCQPHSCLNATATARERQWRGAWGAPATALWPFLTLQTAPPWRPLSPLPRS